MMPSLKAAKEIVDWLNGVGAISFPIVYYNEDNEQLTFWDYDGAVKFIESIIAYEYSEPDYDETGRGDSSLAGSTQLDATSGIQSV